MALTIELLYAKEDVPDFVAFLYSNNCFIRHRNSQKCTAILSLERAVNALVSDLLAPFGTYYIEKENHPQLLFFDSCGRQGHPRHLGKWGRCAGRIVWDDKDNIEAGELFRLIKNYIKKTYFYQRYNGNAKMRCYFGPHYQKLDNEYAQNPDADGTCPGYLRIICSPLQKAYITEMIDRILSSHGAIFQISSSWHQYWEDFELLELHVEFSYVGTLFDYNDFQQIAFAIAEKSSITRMSDSRNHMAAAAHSPLHMIKYGDGINMSFVMERLWQPNINS